MKKYLALALATIVASGSVTVMASAAKQTIEAYYSVNKLIVNGVDTNKGDTAFISNGTTYVPLRTISDALGAEIGWNQNTKTIVINTKKTDNNTGMPQDLPIIGETSPSPQPSVTPNVQVPQMPNTGMPSKPEIKITEQQARDIALKRTGGGQIIFIALDSDYYDPTEYDIPDYDIKIQKGNRIFELEVNAITGMVTDFDLDD